MKGKVTKQLDSLSFCTRNIINFNSDDENSLTNNLTKQLKVTPASVTH